MTRRMALLTSNPALAAPLVTDEALRRLVTVPVVIWVHPSMRLADRVRDLRATVARRARVNDTTFAASLVRYFVYRPVDRGSTPDAATAARALADGRPVLRVTSANDPAAARAVRDASCDLVVVVGSDVLSRQTIGAFSVPLFNVHFSDPAFVRGLPPVFWEVLDGREAIQLTLHQLTPRLDAGPVVAQRDVPIGWRRTLTDTIRQTREAATREIAPLLAGSLPQMFSGSATLRDFEAGPLRTTPGLRDVLRASLICRRRSRQRART